MPTADGPDGASYDAALSGDGVTLAFASLASDLVDGDGDGDGVADVFVHAWLDPGTRTRRSVARWSEGLPGPG